MIPKYLGSGKEELKIWTDKLRLELLRLETLLNEVSVSSSAPSGAAGGVLAGTYPDPSFAVDMATQAELDAAIAAISIDPYQATIVGQVLVSLDGSTFVPKLPVTDPTAGWLVDGTTGLMIVS